MLLDAVIGVVGVFGIGREGGGLNPRLCSLPEAPCPRFGIFRGAKLIGGRLNGWRFFLWAGVLGFSLSAFAVGMKELFLALGLRWSLVGSGCTGMEMLPVELLWILAASRPFKPDFFFSTNEISAGEALGDSYALGMAGTGGTPSSSSAGMGLCTVVCFGAGKREVDEDGGTRGCAEPIDVLTVLKLVVEPTERPEL